MEFSKKVSWVSPSFMGKNGNVGTDFEASSLKPESGKRVTYHERRKHTVSKAKVQQSQDMSWIEKFKPDTKEELAVHKKKVSEVEMWLKDNVQQCLNNMTKKAQILILTGPTGSGKTATVQALCGDLNVEVYEWSNPDQSQYWKPQSEGLPVFDEMRDAYQNQSSLFSNFLLRANKYSLFGLQQRIILVEDIPNTFMRDPIAFHSILRKYHKSAKCPVIFIISDDTKGENIVTRLLPKLLQSELKISNICFNPVSPMMMMKILNKINNGIREGCSQSKLTKTQMEEIASDSMGDIRNAINSFHFHAMPRSKSLKAKKPQVLKRTKSGLMKVSEDESTSNSSRDSSLFLFHALGKILYCKRNITSQEKEVVLPLHLSHLERVPLVADPEDVFGKTSISAEGFSLFLHQNFLSFVEDINVVSECSLWLSQSEILHAHWNDRNVMDDYSASLTARGLMFHLVPTDSGHRWRPLHKPQFYSIKKNASITNDMLRNVFKDKCTSLRELQTEVIPFQYKIGANKLVYDQAELVSRLGAMSTKSIVRSQPESLDTKDDHFEMDTNDNHTRNIISNPEIALPLDKEAEDEVIVIEEYDF